MMINRLTCKTCVYSEILSNNMAQCHRYNNPVNRDPSFWCGEGHWFVLCKFHPDPKEKALWRIISWAQAFRYEILSVHSKRGVIDVMINQGEDV